MKKILIASALAGIALTMSACGNTPDNSEMTDATTETAVGSDAYAPEEAAPLTSEDATAAGVPDVAPSDVQNDLPANEASDAAPE